jgi:RNA polymerase sigma-70 factor (ECF subfamily)
MTTIALDETQLAERLADDLDGSFPDLVVTMQDGVFSGAIRFTRNRHDAEDVTQETFVRAYRALRGYDTDRIRWLRIRSWVWTIALNLCRNLARTKARKPESLLESDPHAGDDPEAAAVAAAQDVEWRRRLETLTDAQRTAVVLRHVVGLPYDEIAETTGRKVGTVKADVHRGVERLRRLLVAEEVT